ncbi:hypothetical protein [Marinobacter sp. BSs20148]|uniref:hypothetical protein n=1 Tax=Marinobacter sp. BSs20148 TaxID=490759 RepID=UPI0002777521|nr:hypothetical protein [Marinobacter sp. BSs20148]AFP32437.1 hypothetical protein MRBBS_3501 [Marinobacter sp. BSs20148]
MDNSLYQNRRCARAACISYTAGISLLLAAASALGETTTDSNLDSNAWLQQPALSAHQLDEASGRQGISLQWQNNSSNQNANVSDNVLAGQVMTGNNLISGGAFQNMSGVATVIQNSGNQVVIQDTTQINVLINR